MRGAQVPRAGRPSSHRVSYHQLTSPQGPRPGPKEPFRGGRVPHGRCKIRTDGPTRRPCRAGDSDSPEPRKECRMPRSAFDAPQQLDIEVTGHLSAEERQYAAEKIAALATYAHKPLR